MNGSTWRSKTVPQGQKLLALAHQVQLEGDLGYIPATGEIDLDLDREDPDSPAPEDIAYLGRLRRPDGQGTFLLIAGIHAIGSLGVAHFLAENITGIYQEAGAKPFSMVIAADYEPGTKTILGSRALSGVLLHETA
ncbi:hypothetical protein ACIQRS_09315 [Streptomyces termitum]|uniref:Uncharacterized protein n=1 Tax=Streptomyces termitum TaxID=67368 RepID=A0A918W227_9ACTN|nr:hypothetical protein [Streptomyces termitum]GHA63400.1 hypothetical protein GCM10010305_00910 [Streptomyces termitum]